MKKIAIIVNKNWETEPVLDSMTNSTFRPVQLPFPQTLNSPKDGNNKMNVPRAVYNLMTGAVPTLQVSVWCIQDLMYFNIPPDPTKQSSSSSEEKYRVLPPVLAAENPDLVIAVGTAGSPTDISLNGSVVIGANFFIHDGNTNNPLSKLKSKDFGKVLPSNVNSNLFNLISNDFKNAVESKFIKTPRNPAEHAVCIASKVYTALSSVNVTDYTEYNWVDPEAIAHFRQVEKKLPFNSLETTHGVIKLSTTKPIIFVSAITDQLEHFDVEVNPTQNYVPAFNAGIVLGQLVVALNGFAQQGNGFGG
ncbi:MAG: hypothetical protein IAF38_09560 [Bacteroidia bacterium]|nr:hypothetical protein [Bacteroidia bacterium]